MGANSIHYDASKKHYKSAREAYQSLREEEAYEYGHDPYNGTITTCSLEGKISEPKDDDAYEEALDNIDKRESASIMRQTHTMYSLGGLHVNQLINLNLNQMPNHVYAQITVSEKYSKKLEEIAKVGLCRYYKPMPDELINTSSPARIVTQSEYDKQMEKNKTDKFKHYPLTIDRQKMLLDKYDADNWYDWASKYWGTKWGCYDNEWDNDTYRFTTAWGPVAPIIMAMLIKDIPTFDYYYEEEQGWGAEFVMIDGVEISTLEWDTPDWDSTDHDDIYFLENDYQNGIGNYKKGYYGYGSLDEYLGDTLEEAIKEL